jgi:hypothetical protein
MNTSSKIAAVAFAALAVVVPASLRSQDAGTKFTQEQLEQMVAPIALYSDPLLTQILMASNYPLEIVEAERWVEQNPGLKGSALEEALKTQEWDPSVKALCGVPTVLKKMNDELNWTRDLGDAFLGQKAELMDTVQRMRKKAVDAGSLKTTEQQKVSQDGDTVVVEPASPDVVYVPAYSPLVVYGPGWYYPYWYYPGFYYPAPYPGVYVSFGFGFVWGSAFWGHCDWSHHTVVVDVVRYRTFTTHTSVSPGGAFLRGATSGQVAWTHDPAHRMGVGYRSPEVARSFGGATGANRAPAPRDRAFTFGRGREATPPPMTPRSSGHWWQRPPPMHPRGRHDGRDRGP